MAKSGAILFAAPGVGRWTGREGWMDRERWKGESEHPQS